MLVSLDFSLFPFSTTFSECIFSGFPERKTFLTAAEALEAIVLLEETEFTETDAESVFLSEDSIFLVSLISVEYIDDNWYLSNFLTTNRAEMDTYL